MRSIRRSSVMAVLACGGVCACQSYRPITLAQASPGHTVRIELTPRGRAALAAKVGPNVEWIMGPVVGPIVQGDSAHLTMRVTTVHREQGIDEVYQGLAPIDVSRDDIAALELRGVDTPRSLLLAGAIATAAVLIGHNFNSGNPSSGGTTSGGSGSQ